MPFDLSDTPVVTVTSLSAGLRALATLAADLDLITVEASVLGARVALDQIPDYTDLVEAC